MCPFDIHAHIVGEKEPCGVLVLPDELVKQIHDVFKEDELGHGPFFRRTKL